MVEVVASVARVSPETKFFTTRQPSCWKYFRHPVFTYGAKMIPFRWRICNEITQCFLYMEWLVHPFLPAAFSSHLSCLLPQLSDCKHLHYFFCRSNSIFLDWASCRLGEKRWVTHPLSVHTGWGTSASCRTTFVLPGYNGGCMDHKSVGK